LLFDEFPLPKKLFIVLINELFISYPVFGYGSASIFLLISPSLFAESPVS